jgi:mono/diheme cytochrome c family protein
MTKFENQRNDQGPNPRAPALRHSDFGLLSDFGIRISDFVLLLGLLSLVSPSVPAASPPTTDYSSVDSIFSSHCLDCHASTDPEGQLVLESYETLTNGGELGPAILPGKSADSLLVKMIEGRFEKNGKKKIMPPGKRKKLTAEEIATIKAWIDGGAKP